MIDDVLLFLSGKTLDVRTGLRERMHKASDAQDYERGRAASRCAQVAGSARAAADRGGRRGGDADAISLARDGDDAWA